MQQSQRDKMWIHGYERNVAAARFAFLLPVVLVALVLSGCGDHGGPSGVGDVSHTVAPPPQQVVGNGVLGDSGPVVADSGPGAPNPIATSAPSSQDFTGGDPMMRGMSDPFAGKKSASPSSDLTFGVKPPLSAHMGNNRLIKNWYWIRGSVAGGRVTISINHVPMGTYSSHLDYEITDKLTAGVNQVEFEQVPTTSHMPVRAHIEVVFSQQAQGALPVLTYDTQQLAKKAPSADEPRDNAAVPDWQHPGGSFLKSYSRSTDTLSFSAS